MPDETDPLGSFKTLIIIPNILAILLCCYMILYLLVRPTQTAREQTTDGSSMTELSQGQSPRTNNSVRFNCSQGLVLGWKKTHTFILFITKYYRLEFRHLNTQKWLRLGASLSFLIANISRLYTTITAWPLDSSIWPRIGSLFYTAFFWLAITLHTTALLDRFERIEMIVPKTWSYKVVQTIKFMFIFLGLAIVAIESYSKIKWIFNDIHDYSIQVVNSLSALLSAFVGLGSILLELSLNLRLMHTSLKLHIETYSGNEPRGHSRRYKRLRNKMIILYCILLGFDALTLFSFAAASLFGKSSDTIALLTTACATLHLFVSFKLLDMFLRELKQAKLAQTTVITSTGQNSNIKGLGISTTTEVVSKGLFPSSGGLSSRTGAEYQSMFTSYTKKDTSDIYMDGMRSDNAK